MTKSDRANFGSKLGVILASAGSAVGLGNIWRFPYETGNRVPIRQGLIRNWHPARIGAG